MTFTRLLVPVVLVAALAACAPAATSAPFRAVDGPNTFSLTVDGVPVPTSPDGFVLTGDGYDIDLQLGISFVNLTVDNRSSSAVRVVPAGSRFTLADGTSSAVVTSAFLRDPSLGALPFAIDAGSQGRVGLIPAERVRPDGPNVALDPMFPWPITEPTSFTLDLAIDEAGVVRTRVLVFAADGPEAP